MSWWWIHTGKLIEARSLNSGIPKGGNRRTDKREQHGQCKCPSSLEEQAHERGHLHQRDPEDSPVLEENGNFENAGPHIIHDDRAEEGLHITRIICEQPYVSAHTIRNLCWKRKPQVSMYSSTTTTTTITNNQVLLNMVGRRHPPTRIDTAVNMVNTCAMPMTKSSRPNV